MDDAVDRYRAASEAGDIEALMATITPDAELVSPLSGRMVFRGAGDLRILLEAVYSTTADLRRHEQVGEGTSRVVIGTFRVGRLRAGDAMAFDLAEDGRIRRIRPHLRPWLATTLFAILLGPKVARHPGIIRRALK